MVSDNGLAFIAEETQKLFPIDLLIGDLILRLPHGKEGFGNVWCPVLNDVSKNVVGVRRISYIELQTLVMEIEAILNNRPLCQDYDSEIEDVLTPNHLIYGRRLENINDSKTISIEIDGYNELDKKEKKLASSITYFWDIWRKE